MTTTTFSVEDFYEGRKATKYITISQDGNFARLSVADLKFAADLLEIAIATEQDVLKQHIEKCFIHPLSAAKDHDACVIYQDEEYTKLEVKYYALTAERDKLKRFWDTYAREVDKLAFEAQEEALRGEEGKDETTT